MFICAGKLESFEFAKSIGIGLIDSSIELTRICLQQVPKSLIFLGSAGSYNENVNIGDIYYSFKATQIEISYLQNKSYTPIDNAIEISHNLNVSCETFNKLSNKLANIKQATINSSNYITSTSKYNSTMINIGITLENMEFFSVLKVSQIFKIPCIGIFCVSNFVNESAHEEFIKNHYLIKEKLKDFISNFYKII